MRSAGALTLKSQASPASVFISLPHLIRLSECCGWSRRPCTPTLPTLPLGPSGTGSGRKTTGTDSLEGNGWPRGVPSPAGPVAHCFHRGLIPIILSADCDAESSSLSLVRALSPSSAVPHRAAPFPRVDSAFISVLLHRAGSRPRGVRCEEALQRSPL
ncbi:hypothetical protein AAFF_G00248890 [Aldrovandia affinis]|uniref:Uncharacterized protein n=1 Tax=Aldrovandia affinis TaxID=143900 RepID=A0AAD7RDN4_9TELE|nr:hypothetical protein AAFF_G00248890 [Aldrovandia affinis]